MSTTTPARQSASTPAVRTGDPWNAMRQEMNEWLAKMWNGGSELLPAGAFAPALDVSEKDECFEVRMDVPGMEAKDLDIQVQGNTLTISGQRKEEKEEKGKTFHRVERRSGSFSRTVTLPCGVTEGEVAADYTNGVLSIVLPKSEDARPRKIRVKG